MNRHFILFAIVFAAALSGVAKTFDIDISTGRPAASNEAYYHGETIEFRAVRGRSAVTNIEYGCIYYQTNGMDGVWWKTDGLCFHPTNDVGAASYRFFLEGRDEIGRDWHANGLLRLLDSPGFTPNEIELPVASLDFAKLDVANAPYYTKSETDEAIASATPAETDPTVPDWAKAASKPTYSASEVGAVTAPEVYRIVAGTNVLLVVTNYNSTAHAAELSLQRLDPETGEYVTYWDEMTQHGITLAASTNHANAAVAAEAARADRTFAPRAWSRTTSGLGAEAPEGVTVISTPVTHISSGFEYEKRITSRGTVWTLCSTSLAAGATTNGFFEIGATDGTPIFTVEKTDSVLVGVNPSDVVPIDGTLVVGVPAVADSHPFARVATTLKNATWYKETDSGMPVGSPAAVSWSGSSGAWVATIDFGNSPVGFVFFEYIQEGSVRIKCNAASDLSSGIDYGGKTYYPRLNGTKLEFIER